MPLEVKLCLCVLALPMAAFIVQVAVGRWLPRGGDYVPTGAMAGALAISLYLFAGILGAEGGMDPKTWEVSWVRIGTEGSARSGSRRPIVRRASA